MAQVLQPEVHCSSVNEFLDKLSPLGDYFNEAKPISILSTHLIDHLDFVLATSSRIEQTWFNGVTANGECCHLAYDNRHYVRPAVAHDIALLMATAPPIYIMPDYRMTVRFFLVRVSPASNPSDRA
jgi:hypothetical protein